MKQCKYRILRSPALLLVLIMLVVSVDSCEKLGILEKDHCKQYLGNWIFHYSYSKSDTWGITVSSGYSTDFIGSITRGSGANRINVSFAASQSKTGLKVEDDGSILNVCGENLAPHYSQSCSGYFDGDSIFHYTDSQSTPPNHIVATIGEITGIREDCGIMGRAPEVSTLPVSDLTNSSVTLNGKTDPNLRGTTIYFQYGPGNNTYFSNTVVSGGPFSGSEEILVCTSLTRLTPGSVVHYRLVAMNDFGKTYGNDMVFTVPN